MCSHCPYRHSLLSMLLLAAHGAFYLEKESRDAQTLSLYVSIGSADLAATRDATLDYTDLWSDPLQLFLCLRLKYCLHPE